MQQNPPLHVDLGSIETLLGSLQFTFVVDASGDAHIQVSASGASGGTKSDVLLMLDAQGYERLRAIVRGTDGVIDRLIREGKVRRMALPY
ncbi:MAG TPA: hypothetical protein VJ866_24750 [Pyrinomonadaceae bacterium]|nr:hypothetical protein [Pyrinomonadaceae bacterium]